MAPDKPGFFAELKRRHVWRTAIAYAVAGWLLVQIATQVFPFFDIPNWVVRLVVILIVIGFPVAAAFAWIYEITPEGIRRTPSAGSPDARTEHDARAIGRKLNVAITAVLVLAVVVMGWRLQRHGPAAAATQAATAVPAEPAGAPAAAVAAPRASGAVAAPPIPAKSIAVLPFENLSDDKTNAYFVAGMQNLILTKLADIGDLKVISRVSTAKYASHPDDLKAIGRQLGVATLLEGSVQKQGNQVLINVQLVDATDDGHLWAQSYTRTLDDVFGVEGEVAEQIAAALKAKLSPAESANVAAVPTRNQAAYDLFLRAEYLANKGGRDSDTDAMKASLRLYRQAVEQDPDFALAWARLSFAQNNLAWFAGGGEDTKRLYRQAREDAERALKLQPGLSAAHVAIGYADYYERNDYPVALKAFDAALALKPNDADAIAARGFIARRQGRFGDAIASLEHALVLDPRNSNLADELGETYMGLRRYADAERLLQRSLELDPSNRSAPVDRSWLILLDTGDVARALAAVTGDDPGFKVQRATLLAYQRRYREALALLDGIPDTPDNFSVRAISSAALKPQLQADLYRLSGDLPRSRRLYAQALTRLRTQIAAQQGVNLALAWQNAADAELGLGQTAAGLASIATSLRIVNAIGDHYSIPATTWEAARRYAQARRADLSVPLLAKALASPIFGGYSYYGPVLLWLDPEFDAIRGDPGFQTLLVQYAKYEPTVLYDVAPVASSTAVH